MNITLREVTVRDLIADYADDGTGGVRGYSGKLDIRPPYQREFIYGEKQRAAVIDTILRGFPLNVMYWAARDDGTYEVMDGQQRTISIAQYVAGDFSFDKLLFRNLPDDKKQQVLDYQLMIYVCEGALARSLAGSRRSILLARSCSIKSYATQCMQVHGCQTPSAISVAQMVQPIL